MSILGNYFMISLYFLLFSIFVGLLIIINVEIVYGEVIELETNRDTYHYGDKVIFKGKVDSKSSDLVTIVIRDVNEDFVLLSQAMVDEKNSFVNSVSINEKFLEHGEYTATGFILNMTAGVSTDFVLIENTRPIITHTMAITDVDSAAIEPAAIEKHLATFVDPNKDPQYYLDRYYTEPVYKSWFDRNYPYITIEEAVGFTNSQTSSKTNDGFIHNDLIQEAQALSVINNEKLDNNSEIAQMILAMGGLGILFGAVYGIKKKVDNNSKQISINKDLIKKKLIDPLLGPSPDNILQTRLAKGEISLEEYDELEKKIHKNIR